VDVGRYDLGNDSDLEGPWGPDPVTSGFSRKNPRFLQEIASHRIPH